MRVSEICLTFGHSWPCLKHTGVRLCVCVYTSVDESVALHVSGMWRSEALSKYDSCNHPHALQPAPQAVNSWADTHRACGLTITADKMTSNVCVC